ncbi:MAG TPA: DUF167 domain-containing protein, partial [candidate division WWE3 bacterium]|nr:DUF167 domain-containing protein [candidate division WWE3 bacterium]
MKITTIAHVNSRNPRIEKDLEGNLHIYVREPPLEGRANQAITKALSDHLKIPNSHVNLVKGHKSKIK